MAKLSRSDISFLLNEIAEAVDIPDSLYEAAESKYQAVGSWLGSENSPLASFSPHIYPQGSFMLGTVAKPPSDSDEYDLDLVFELDLSKDNVSQLTLKNMVGDRLKANETYRKMLGKEGRRCWTLQYAESAHFHMDILPAVPDYNTYSILENQGVPSVLARTSIAITDKTRLNYARIDPDWLRGNPRGYAAWFRQQMIVQYEEQRRRLAPVYKGQMESVPEYRIKTPLQRCIQLQKRNRDIQFKDAPATKPASIILTTLAANAYDNEADLANTLAQVLDRMPYYITTKNGVVWVANPVDPSENFADRWKDNHGQEPAFRSWLRQFKEAVNDVLTCEDIDEVNSRLAVMFGERVTNAVVNRYKETSLGQTTTGGIAVASTRPSVTIHAPIKPWGR